MFKFDKPRCNWTSVKGAYIPAVTNCHLQLRNAYDVPENLSNYRGGFWCQTQTCSLPFNADSFLGEPVGKTLT